MTAAQMIQARWGVSSGFTDRLADGDLTGYAVAISLGLGCLFDENEAAERQWLTAERESLGGMSSLDFIRADPRNVLRINEMVARERGL